MKKKIKNILDIVVYEDGSIELTKDAIRILKENKEIFKALLEGEE